MWKDKAKKWQQFVTQVSLKPQQNMPYHFSWFGHFIEPSYTRRILDQLCLFDNGLCSEGSYLELMCVLVRQSCWKDFLGLREKGKCTWGKVDCILNWFSYVFLISSGQWFRNEHDAICNLMPMALPHMGPQCDVHMPNMPICLVF